MDEPVNEVNEPNCPERAAGLEHGMCNSRSSCRLSLLTVSNRCESEETHPRLEYHCVTERKVTLLGCFSAGRSFSPQTCSALYGQPVQVHVQTAVDVDLWVTLDTDSSLSANHSANLTVHGTWLRANHSANLTLPEEALQRLGPGCHSLRVHALNRETREEESPEIQVCVLQPLAQLQASVLGSQLQDSPLSLNISVDRGNPAQIWVYIQTLNQSHLETRVLTRTNQVYSFGVLTQDVQVLRVTALNTFSTSETQLQLCLNSSSSLHLLCTNSTALVRVVRANVEINASPSAVVPQRSQEVTLSVSGGVQLENSNKRHEWSCGPPCRCQNTSEGGSFVVSSGCLPEPLQFYKYWFKVYTVSNNEENSRTSICVGLNATESDTLRYGPITEQHAQVRTNHRAARSGTDQSQSSTLRYGPITEQHAQVRTNHRAARSGTDQSQSSTLRYGPITEQHTQEETRSCFLEAGSRPLTLWQTSGSSFTVPQSRVTDAWREGQDLRVVLTTEEPVSQFASFRLQSPTPTPPSSAPETSSSPGLLCSVSPSSGTIVQVFNISCSSPSPCAPCKYCYRATSGRMLRCGGGAVSSLFLPLGDPGLNWSVTVNVTAKSGAYRVSTTTTTQVLEVPWGHSSLREVQASVQDSIDLLRSESELSPEVLGTLLRSVGEMLNHQKHQESVEDRRKFREALLDLLMKSSFVYETPEEIQVLVSGLNSVTQNSELSTTAQEKAASLLSDLSSRLVQIPIGPESRPGLVSAAESIVQGASTLLQYSSQVNVSRALLRALEHTQSALAKGEDFPSVVHQGDIALMVHKVPPDQVQIQGQIPNCSCPWFDLQSLPQELFEEEESVELRMLALQRNPFEWNPRANVSAPIVSLTLQRENHTVIPVHGLKKNIQIFLPNPVSHLINSSVLHLSNYSTTILHLPPEPSTLVLKMIPSVDPLPFKAYLGEEHPTESTYIARIQLPQEGETLGERYTWMLDPSDLGGRSGQLFLLVRPLVGPGVKSINASLSITVISTRCNFWNQSLQEWSTAGCKVGAGTTAALTQCLCDHLTFFGGSFFVVPNVVDPSQSAQLFGTFTQNPVVVCLVLVLFLLYLLLLIWAHRKDRQDTRKVKVTVLADNDPCDKYQYLLTVSSGHRRGAATSAQVTVVLVGSITSSAPHHLTDSQKPVFQRGAVDMFLLKAPGSLGDIQAVRLWHNNEGEHPNWFVSSVVVQDLQTGQKFHVLCNSWIGLDIGDGTLDQLFPVTTSEELRRFSNLFFMKTTRDLSDGHLWLSVVTRPPSSSFSRVQRLSCCFSLLLCTMLTSIMFYGIPTDPADQVMDLGQFEFTWQQFKVGIQSSLIMFPVNILIVSLFRFSRLRTGTRTGPCSCCRPCQDQNSPQTITKKVTKLVQSLSKSTEKSKSRIITRLKKDLGSVLSELEEYMSLRDLRTTAHEDSESKDVDRRRSEEELYSELCHLEKHLSSMDPEEDLLRPTRTRLTWSRLLRARGQHLLSFSQSLQKVQVLKERLRDTEEDYSLPRAPPRRALPWWCVYVAWLLVAASSGVSGYFTMLYGLKFGKEKSISWVVSMGVSFFQSLLLIQPLKVVGMAVFFALVVKKVEEEELENVQIYKDSNLRVTDRDLSLYQPPPPVNIERMRRNREKEVKAYALLTEILVYLGFMWMLLLVVYAQRDPNTFYLNQHLLTSFRPTQDQSLSLDQVHTWAQTTLLPKLYGPYPGFITDGNSLLVGVARLRQLRVRGSSPSCEAPPSRHLHRGCPPVYSWATEDTGSYGPRWTPPSSPGNSTHPGNHTHPTPWRYQTQGALRGAPFWGRNLLYRGGGYVSELGPDLHGASSTLQYLYSSRWLDSYTRAVFVEFTVYNANVNLFCLVTLLLEAADAVGAFEFRWELRPVRLYPSTGGLHLFVMAAEVLYMLFVLYYMYKQIQRLRVQCWAYLRDCWNILELSIIALSWTGAGLYIQRTVLGQRDIEYYQQHKDKFPSFCSSASSDVLLQYVLAFIVLLSTVKLWHLLRLNPNMELISSTLSRASGDITGFLLVIGLMLVAYATACNSLYGWKMASYKTFPDSLLTLIKLQLGIFNYDEVMDYSPVLGAVLVGSCIIFMGFVAINLLISVILVAFQQEQVQHKPSEDEEVVQIMLNKVFGLFGIRYTLPPSDQDEKCAHTEDSG
ncbi:polycystic kidney disease protein 1-like 2 [Periophthalmus magnuspinnatus]|uniref:polycystic kidney disease protein 1-like 2 n=1 Tax=Periophthalmus magnuspinnatus TaxID=409849 RepID=UPI0024365297|nr:polycystic kidney disease protein 1-like 2 [Periophthalmus magnuspinnatus]